MSERFQELKVITEFDNEGQAGSPDAIKAEQDHGSDEFKSHLLHQEISYYYARITEIQLHVLYVCYIRALIHYLKQEGDLDRHPKIFTKPELKKLFHYQPKHEEDYTSFIDQLEKLSKFFNDLLEDVEEQDNVAVS